jgi:Ca2+-binding EF-hand superfamily protein
MLHVPVSDLVASALASSSQALGEPIDRQTIELMIESVDTDKNGFIDFNEFRQMMKEGPVELPKD